MPDDTEDKLFTELSIEEVENLSDEEIHQKFREEVEVRMVETFEEVFEESALKELDEAVDHDKIKEMSHALFDVGITEGIRIGFNMGTKLEYLDDVTNELQTIRQQLETDEKDAEDLGYIG